MVVMMGLLDVRAGLGGRENQAQSSGSIQAIAVMPTWGLTLWQLGVEDMKCLR